MAPFRVDQIMHQLDIHPAAVQGNPLLRQRPRRLFEVHADLLNGGILQHGALRFRMITRDLGIFAVSRFLADARNDRTVILRRAQPDVRICVTNMRNVALEGVKFVFLKEVRNDRVVGRVEEHLVVRHGEGDVRFDGHQRARQIDIAAGLLELPLLAGRQLGQMGIDSVHRPILCDELGGTDFADALDAGDVVGRVAAEGQHVDHLRGRGNAPFLRQLGRTDDLVVPAGLAGLVLQDVRGDQLAVILVRRHHVDPETGGFCAAGHGTDDVVGLETVLHQHRHPERMQQLRQRLQRIDDQLRRRRARTLVGRIHLIAERAAGRVEGHGEMRRLFAVDELQQIFSETEEDGSVHPLRVDHRPAEERVVHLEDERVSVNEI